MRPTRKIFLLLLTGACSSPSPNAEGTSSSSNSEDTTASTAVASTGIPTSSEEVLPASTSSTSSSSTSVTTSSTTSMSSTSSSEDATDDEGMATTEPGGPSSCGPPCDVTWTHIGDLEINPSKVDNADAFACVTQVVGDVIIFGFDQNKLAGLRNLVNVEGSLLVGHSEMLSDLSVFECLETVSNTLGISHANNLLIPSGMSKLRSAFTFSLDRTGATVMPFFAPDFTVGGNVLIENNQALTTLDAAVAWKSVGGTAVVIQDNASLTSIEGINSVLVTAQLSAVSLYKLPALTSLAGLNGVTELSQLGLRTLPLVGDLSPLAQLEHVNTLVLYDLPKITDLQGLNQLKTVDYLQIGGCWSAPLIGNMGLESLNGLSSLTSVGSLGIGWNANLSTLAGADKLTSIEVRWAAEFNNLDEADLAAFATQVGSDPCDIDSDPECSCFN